MALVCTVHTVLPYHVELQVSSTSSPLFPILTSFSTCHRSRSTRRTAKGRVWNRPSPQLIRTVFDITVPGGGQTLQVQTFLHTLEHPPIAIRICSTAHIQVCFR